jgi:hypothetical protein
MAVRAMDCVLLWFEVQEHTTEEGVADLARQMVALSLVAITDVGRNPRFGCRLHALRIQYLDMRANRLQRENRALRTNAFLLNLDVAQLRSEGRFFLSQLRAVLLAYRPGAAVTTPLAIPLASAVLGEIGADGHAVDEALEVDLGDRRTRNRLLARLP